MDIRIYYLNLGSLAFIGLILILIVSIMVIMFIRNEKERKHQRWKFISELLIRKAIFSDELEEAESNLLQTPRIQKLLLNRHFRKVLTSELINARKNMSGSSSRNIINLYKQLRLHQESLLKLKTGKWYEKAQVIQEVSIMEMKEHLTKIYRFINNANDLLRMEAQIAVIRLYGFEGFRFLDVVTYPISEWQQIKLLATLSDLPPDNFTGIEKWLHSTNHTVVIFALKLVKVYHRFELHDQVTPCLQHPAELVRIQAIITLGEIYNDQTSAILILRYLKETFKSQMAIIKVLQEIGTDDDLPVLQDQLSTDNIELKVTIARAMVKIGPAGADCLRTHEHASQYPLTEIIAQIETELSV